MISSSCLSSLHAGTGPTVTTRLPPVETVHDFKPNRVVRASTWQQTAGQVSRTRLRSMLVLGGDSRATRAGWNCRVGGTNAGAGAGRVREIGLLQEKRTTCVHVVTFAWEGGATEA